MSKDHTHILIVHHLSTILNPDLIYMLEKGKIVEIRSNDSLLEKMCLYYTYGVSRSVNAETLADKI